MNYHLFYIVYIQRIRGLSPTPQRQIPVSIMYSIYIHSKALLHFIRVRVNNLDEFKKNFLRELSILQAFCGPPHVMHPPDQFRGFLTPETSSMVDFGITARVLLSS